MFWAPFDRGPPADPAAAATMSPLSLLFLATVLATVRAGPAAGPCTTGTPATTAGYVINYSQAAPTPFAAGAGYEPAPAWSSRHVLGTYTYGVPAPLETGFAFAQFKCQFKCNSFDSASFFVEYAGNDSQAGSYCSCFNALLTNDAFVSSNETVVGAWNSICGVTHPDQPDPELHGASSDD